MTRNQLNQYLALKREIKLLEGEIIHLESRSSDSVTDVVSGSCSSFPYIKRTFIISGKSEKYIELLNRKSNRLKDRKERLAKEADEIDQFIDRVTDSQMRQILTYRFLDGLPWLRVANKVGGNNTAASVKMACKRFLEK